MPLFPRSPVWGPWVNATPNGAATVTQPLQVRKDSTGRVEMRGKFTIADATNSSTLLATIPALYAHPSKHHLMKYGAEHGLWIQPGGSVVHNGPTWAATPTEINFDMVWSTTF